MQYNKPKARIRMFDVEDIIVCSLIDGGDDGDGGSSPFPGDSSSFPGTNPASEDGLW